jgi:acetylornithine deacetylase
LCRPPPSPGLSGAQSLKWVQQLVSIDTTSSRSNQVLIELVAAELSQYGVDPVLIPNDTGTKLNLLATFVPEDGCTTGGIMFSGHTDVVPVVDQNWSSDPFDPEVRHGNLYGRGTCDMKSFIGSVVAAVPNIVSRPLRRPIHFAFSYDEEVGCIGAIDLVEEVRHRNLSPEICIVGEPTEMRVVRAHKSVSVVHVDIRGVSAHSSRTPDGVNAVEHGAKLIQFVTEMAGRMRAFGPYDDAFDVAWSTCSVNQISGGIAVNTVPGDCSIAFEFRSINRSEADGLHRRFSAQVDWLDSLMKKENPYASAEMRASAAVPPLETGENAAAAALARSLGGIPTNEQVAYSTEAGMFASIGIPTVVCGPGSITQAHIPDEYVSLDQLAKCDRFVSSAIEYCRT